MTSFISVDLNDVEADKIRNIEIDIVFHLAAARADWGVVIMSFFAITWTQHPLC